VVVQRYSFVLSLIIDGVCTGKGKWFFLIVNVHPHRTYRSFSYYWSLLMFYANFFHEYNTSNLRKKIANNLLFLPLERAEKGPFIHMKFD
jgi:hypothetical protein